MIQVVTEAMVRHDLARAAVFYTRTLPKPTIEGDRIGVPIDEGVAPPMEVIRDLMAVPDLADHFLALRLIDIPGYFDAGYGSKLP